MRLLVTFGLLVILHVGCNSDRSTVENSGFETKASVSEAATPAGVTEPQSETVCLSDAEIESLIDQLVFDDGDANDQPVISPGVTDRSAEYRNRFSACQLAFQKLAALKEVAFPHLVKHLDDKRQSINFRNHHVGNSVGDACYWNIHFQLQDRPHGYSRYGYSRKGRDGEQHPKPYYLGCPFDDAGGLREWLVANEDLNYRSKQIKCLTWLLEKEKMIGAHDPESYFINILPLEIRILEHRLENGEDVGADLMRLRKIQTEKLVDQVPQELLPE